jgi:hypothetical protein
MPTPRKRPALTQPMFLAELPSQNCGGSGLGTPCGRVEFLVRCKFINLSGLFLSVKAAKDAQVDNGHFDQIAELVYDGLPLAQTSELLCELLYPLWHTPIPCNLASIFAESL